ADFPTSSLSAAVWVRSAPDATPYSEIEAKLPAAVKDHVEVLHALSIRAIQAGETILATSLTRKARDGSPDSPELKAQYANLIVNAEGRASIDGKGSCPEKLSEAIILLNQVLEIANAKDEIGWLRYTRAEANDLVGRDNEAETDYRAALETNLQE